MISVLPDIVQSASHKFGEKEAYKYADKAISFQELNEITTNLAKFLIDSGVEKGDRVGIYLNRSMESVIAVYGIMKAGAVFVPLDPSLPTSRTAFLIKDCGIRILITSQKQYKKLSELFLGDVSLRMVIGVDRELSCPSITWEEVNQRTGPGVKLPVVKADDLAYIMYTSGSTGLPKGIMHTHRSGLNYASLSAQLYQLNSNDRVASHAPLHFDISTFSYFTAPLSGACTVIIPDAFTKMPVSLSELMEKERISIWYSVPLALIQLLQRGLLDQRDLSSLRWVLFGGEVFPPKYLRRLMKLWPQATFCNVYGPAEINQCTYYHLKTPPEPDAQIPLGTVWNEASFKVIDHQDEAVSRGETGELVVHTKSMMRGYWNNPELTKKSNYQDKQSGDQRIYYRTGDLVKEDENGALVFMGRNDRQVKLRGYRVELDEVEAVLSRHPQVKEAATFLLDQGTGDHQLAAAVILSEEADLGISELVSHCANILPGYAVPDRIEILSDLPRTSSGKIKRSVLSKLIRSGSR